MAIGVIRRVSSQLIVSTDGSALEDRGALLPREYRTGEVAEGGDYQVVSDVAPFIVRGTVTNAADYDNIIQRHYRAMSSLIRTRRNRNVTRQEVSVPRTSLASDGTSIRSAKISQSFTLDRDTPVLTSAAMGADGVLILGQQLVLDADAVLDGDTSLALDADAVLALSSTSLTKSLDADAFLATTFLEVVSFRWSDDVTTPNWYPADRAPGNLFHVVPNYVLAVRVKLNGPDSIPSPGTDLQFEFSLSTSPTTNTEALGWHSLGDFGVSGYLNLAVPTLFPKSHGQTITQQEFVCNPGGGNLVNGVFSCDSQVGVQLQPGEETELWFGMSPDADMETFYMYGRMNSSTGGIVHGPEFAPTGAWSDLGIVP